MSYIAAKDPAEFAFARILYEKHARQPGRATVTINRPDVYNAFDFQTLREMAAAFLDAAHDDSVAVLVLTGAGDRAFCTGADLKEQQQHCVGSARGSVPAGGATQWLPLIVGDRRAREILFLCEEIPAAKALEWGLVNQVVPREKLDEAVDAMCVKLINKLPGCIRYTKQQLNFWRDFSWSMTIGHARDWLALNNLTFETQEGIAAFNEKRPVDYDRVRRGG